MYNLAQGSYVFLIKRKSTIQYFREKTPYKYVVAMVTSAMMDKDVLYQIVSR